MPRERLLKRAATSSQSAIFIRVHAAKPCGGSRFDPKTSRKSNPGQPSLPNEEASAREKGSGKSYAVNSTPGSSRRGGRGPVAGESLHSHAVLYQVNLERRRGHRRSSVAAKRVWAVPFPLPHPRGHITTSASPANNYPADICLKETS